MERAFDMGAAPLQILCRGAILESAAYGMCEIACEARRDMDWSRPGA
jgi:hypothetical protein